MPSGGIPTQPSNVTAPRNIQKRKRDPASSRLSANKSARSSTPNAYARRTPPPIEDEDEDAGRRSPPKQLKRPGAGARIAREQREAADAARREREQAERKGVVDRQKQFRSAELVAEHYNAVPERGREWRKTDSQIKGLRNLNNWIKSTLIQKFSRPEIPPQHGLTVLDMACGKGGDLGKWEKAPTVPALYVGCDIAEVSVSQAIERYAETRRKNSGRHRRQMPMQAEFYVQDTFGRSLGDIPIVQQVGFNPNAGPGPGIIQGRMVSGGFDVVSMMFALHYSFESEALARGMLRNVAGALKKGGRFIGVMPSSDVVSATVKRLLQAEAPTGKSSEREGVEKVTGPGSPRKGDGEADDWDPEKPSETNGDTAEDDWDPERPSEALPPAANGTVQAAHDAKDEDWDPEKPSEPSPSMNLSGEQAQCAHDVRPNGASSTPAQHTLAAATPADVDLPLLQWGNSIYTIRFPRHQTLTHRPLPRDGIFRPAYGWKYHYSLEEAVNAPEYVVPWEGFRALAEDYGLELLYRKGFREVFEDESTDRELGILAERMGVMSRDRSAGNGGLLVSEEEMEAASFYHAFCFYKT